MRVWLCLILSFLILLFGCKAKEDTIKIGVAAPLSGSIAKMGNDFKNGITIAVEEWNSKGGIKGKKIELLIEDDANDPKQAVTVANKLVNLGVTAVIGHFTSSCSMAASEVYHKANVPVINASSTNPQLTQRGHKNIFRICGRDDLQGMVAAMFINSQLNAKRVAIIHDKTTYGQGLADEFKKNIKPPAEVVYYGGITQGEKDFKSVLTTIKSLNPDVLYFGGIYPEGGLITRQARELGITASFISGDALTDVKFVEIAGERAAEGSYITFSPDFTKSDSAKAFLQKYKAKYGEPGPYSVYAYDAANIILKAISESPDTKGSSIIDTMRKSTFTGVLSQYRFDEKGDVTHMPYVVWKITGGKYIEYWKP
ncbi:MAG: branched-chain amino acid ABC transporter substrate-binding protein [Thermodesulfovibrionales bacterium]|nr:branched-chain amino acid ABC transporter substrate-binding protein [Thermodesulfovibrionales bacterium]